MPFFRSRVRHCRLIRRARRGRDFCQPEVQNFGVTALGDKDIRRLDVAVDNSFGVGGIECVGNLDGHTEQNVRLRRLSCNPMLQRHALEKLHGDKGRAVLVINFVNGTDVGMIEGRSSLSFSFETVQSLRVFGDVIGQELQGDKAAQLEVFSFVDHAHPATAKFLEDAVVGNRLADQGKGLPVCAPCYGAGCGESMRYGCMHAEFGIKGKPVNDN